MIIILCTYIFSYFIAKYILHYVYTDPLTSCDISKMICSRSQAVKYCLTGWGKIVVEYRFKLYYV